MRVLNMIPIFLLLLLQTPFISNQELDKPYINLEIDIPHHLEPDFKRYNDLLDFELIGEHEDEMNYNDESLFDEANLNSSYLTESCEECEETFSVINKNFDYGDIVHVENQLEYINKVRIQGLIDLIRKIPFNLQYDKHI